MEGWSDGGMEKGKEEQKEISERRRKRTIFFGSSLLPIIIATVLYK